MARDRELQREVALKEIQPRYAEREDQRRGSCSRRRSPATWSTRGSCPSTAWGTTPRAGRTTRCGSSGARASRRRSSSSTSTAGEAGAGRRQRAGSAWGVEFQQLLRRFLDVCDAIEYAHSRGVIHRDLKPGNIMLGRYGETLVVDWGLAKVVGKSDIVRDPRRGGDAGTSTSSPTRRDRDACGGETQPGTTIGTPSYMSPEQARGRDRGARAGQRRLQPGGDALRAAHRHVPVPRPSPCEIIAKVKEGGLTPPAPAAALDPPAARGHLPEGDGVRAGEPLSVGARAGPRPRALDGRRAGRGLSRAAAPAAVAVAPPASQPGPMPAAVALMGITLVATIAVVLRRRRTPQRGGRRARRRRRISRWPRRPSTTTSPTSARTRS